MHVIIEFPWTFTMWYDPEYILFLRIQFSKWSTIVKFQVHHLNFFDKFMSCFTGDWVPSDFWNFWYLWCRVFIRLENIVILKSEKKLPPQKFGNLCFILAIWLAIALFKVELKYRCIFGIVVTIDIEIAINTTHIWCISLHLFSMWLKNWKKLTSFTILCQSKLSIGARMCA